MQNASAWFVPEGKRTINAFKRAHDEGVDYVQESIISYYFFNGTRFVIYS